MKAAKNLKYYLSLPYTLILKRDEDGDFVARIDELDGCISHGLTETEALDNLRQMQVLWIQDCLEANQSVPEPASADDSLPSGKWLQRVPRSLHQSLTKLAKQEDVSLNQLVATMLSESIASRLAGQSVTDRIAAALGRGNLQTCNSLFYDPAPLLPHIRTEGWDIQEPQWNIEEHTAEFPALMEAVHRLMPKMLGDKEEFKYNAKEEELITLGATHGH